MSDAKYSDIDRIFLWSLAGAFAIAGFFGLLAWLLR